MTADQVAKRPGAFSKRQWTIVAVTVATIVLSLVAVGVLDRWSFGNWLGVAGVVVSIAGFSLAYFEIQHTQEVSAETGRAVGLALRAVASSRLAIVITQLRQLVVDLEDACDKNDSTAARRTLNDWRMLGTEAEGLMKRRFGEDSEHLSALRRSVRLASDAKPLLFSDVTTQEATTESLDAMSKTADALGPLLEEIAPTMEGLDANG
jgi:hypothetical protein